MGNPTQLTAVSGPDAGEVKLHWKEAANATVYWIWSARLDYTGGQWTRRKRNTATVRGLEPGQDYRFIVIASRTVNGAPEWSHWSNWAIAQPALPVPFPTPESFGNPTNLTAVPGRIGEVSLRWEPAAKATVHWVWSVKADNTGGRWFSGKDDSAAVGKLEARQDYRFIVVAGQKQDDGQYRWSQWSNWAGSRPAIEEIRQAPPPAGGAVRVNIIHTTSGPEAVAITPCDGVAGAALPAIHGGGSPTGASCNVDPGVNFNLTPLVSQGHTLKIQLACVNRMLVDCGLINGDYRADRDLGFVERVLRRTNGQVRFEVTSFPELGVAGPDTLRLIGDGTLEAAQIHPGHIAGDHPIVDIGNLWGLYPSQYAQLKAVHLVQPKMAELTRANGGVQVAYMMTGDYYLFSRREVHDDPHDLQGFKVRSFATALSDLMSGLGAEPQFLDSPDVYTALGRGSIDGAVSCASCGYDQRWYEVADYIVGPIHSISHSWLTVSDHTWNKLPQDLQNIILEEGARHAYLNRHFVLTDFDPIAVKKNIKAGLKSAQFSYWIRANMRQAAIEHVVPNWVDRAGGPHSDAVHLFNEFVYPIVDVYINPDGSASLER